MQYGLDEIAFGKFDICTDRMYLLNLQLLRLKEQQSLRFGFNLENKRPIYFETMFEADLQHAKGMFDHFKQVDCKQLSNVIFTKYTKLMSSTEFDKKFETDLNIGLENYRSIKSLGKLDKTKLQNTLLHLLEMSEINKNQFINCGYIKKKENYKRLFPENELYISFEEFKIIYQTYEKIKNSKEVCVELNKQGLIDFSNPNISLRAGHIYWRTLEVANAGLAQITNPTTNRGNPA